MQALAAVLFFASGVAALLYQVVWQRMLVMFAGSDIHSATIVVSAFMAGLGLGSFAGGRLADRAGSRKSLWLFVAAELAIAGFGWISAWLLYDVLYSSLAATAAGLAVRALVLFASLIVPTFCMGVSLPLLVRALTPAIERAAAITGRLYGVNTMGAAMGALVATWYLLPQYGVANTLGVAAMLNVFAAVAALPVMRALASAASHAPAGPLAAPRGAKGSRKRQAEAPASESAPFSIVPWLVLYGASGFIALSFEIAWFRLLGVLQKSTTLTFGTLLGLYLAGLGIGAAVVSLSLSRVRHSGRAFATCVALAGLAAGGAIVALMSVTSDPQRLPWLSHHLSGYEPVEVAGLAYALGSGVVPELPAIFADLYFWVPLALIGPSTMLMGAAFPFLQRAVQTDFAYLGARVGTLLTANIAGSALGAIVTGWWLFDWIGTAGVLRLLVVLSAGFPLALLLTSNATPKRTWMAVSLAAGVVIAIALPGNPTLWARLHGAEPDQIIAGEDGSGLSVLKSAVAGGRTRVEVYVNGLGQSWIPFGDVHTALGALPAFVHPRPVRAAIIGLGSGDTLFAAGGRLSLERVTGIEIVRPQLDTLRRLHAARPYGGLETVLQDRRIEHVYGDGRQYLLRTSDRFDLIEADALRPTSAYAGLLYSAEYFQLLKDRLAPGGLAVTWAPTPRVVETFVSVFPHAVRVLNILIGSDAPIAMDVEAIGRRLDEPGVQAYFERAGIDIRRTLAPYLASPVDTFGPDFDRRALVDLNTDLFPRDELGVPHRRR